MLRTLHVITTRGGLLEIMSDQRRLKIQMYGSEPESRATRDQQDALMLLAAYLSAIIHDYDHRGLTNPFLIEDEDPLAVRGKEEDQCISI